MTALKATARASMANAAIEYFVETENSAHISSIRWADFGSQLFEC
jgi:hypothetical protein